ncbi:MAG: sulfotransferase [Holophagales bacterium]|nr:sulfotransferase [Holophagales bacterium]
MANPSIRIRQPVALRAVNRVGAVAGRCGLTPFRLTPERILENARRASGFEVRDPMFLEGVERLVHGLETHARLSTFGRLAARGTVQRSADSRSQVERALSEHPEIGDEEVRAPVFIVGMPRSGTTILHALLHLDRNHRAPLSWECLLPHPAPNPDDYRDNERIETVRKEFDQIFRLVPDFRRKHYMTADSPQECIGITALNFASFQYVAMAWLPEYHDWFAKADQVKNLQWHRRFLQFLQSGGVSAGRWLLKSPVHLMRLRALFEVYPDARVIVTHRHPADVVPSVGSLISSMRSFYSDHEDTLRTGREHLLIWADYFARFLRDRRELGREEQMVDVFFDDFVRDQMSVVDAIYARFGWDLRPEDRDRMEQFLQRERRGKHGVHEYSLHQVVTTRSEIDNEYARYLAFLETLRSARRP